MATPFARSMRALQADRGGMALVALITAILLLLLWGGWLFLARIPMYETGSIVRSTGDGLILAHFSTTALERIHPGQSAWVVPQGAAGQPTRRLAAVVYDTPSPARAEQQPVELYVQLDEDNFATVQAGLAGQVEVEVEQLSPAVLIQRATGQLIDSPRLSITAR